MHHPSVPTIVSFRDAVGFAMELTDRYAIVSAAVLLTSTGRPLDVAVAAGFDSSIEPVVAWASGTRRWTTDPCSALLVSVRSFDADVVSEADIQRYRNAGWSLASAGCHLMDWIETDGDLVRSYAYLVDPARAWAGDPPSHRRADEPPT